ncbi:MAG: adenylate/guanylate cyclase domain-containing protein [Myxococcota bacterium]
MIFPLRIKLALVTSVLLGLAIGTVSVLVLSESRDALEGEARKRGMTLAINLARNTRVPLLEQDDVVLGQLLKSVTREDEILGAALFDADGESVASAGVQVPTGARHLSHDEELTMLSVGGHLVISSQISFNGLRVGEAQVVLDLDGLIAPVVARARRKVLIASGGLLGIGILLAFAMSARTTRPLQRLRRAVNALAEGDLSARVAPSTRDEVADLTRAFNEMGESLSQKQRIETAFRRYVSDHVLQEVIESSDPASLHGARREVTVLFVDIRGFTRLTSLLGPERLVPFLDESFELITGCLHEYGATVDKYLGDAILAYFGAPAEMDDHPNRAVAAAISIQRAAQERNRKPAPDAEPYLPLELGIGIHTGIVVLGNVGSQRKMDYTVIGDPVNVASRLQNLARPGEILLTADVAQRVDVRVRLEPLGLKELPGRDGPVEAYRALY